MTKYRAISDGHTEHLQYLKERKFLFLFTVKSWCYIWRPYYDTIFGRTLDVCKYDTYICSYNTNLGHFKSKYTDIDEYFRWASKEQERLELKANKEKEKTNKKKGKIRYL
jgi:hypothetical protein